MSTNALWEPAEPSADYVAFTPYGTIAATTVQGAIEELVDEGTSGGGSGERRYAAAGSYIYLGTAPAGTLDSAPTWILTRLTLAADGSVSATETATDSWDDRVTATYS